MCITEELPSNRSSLFWLTVTYPTQMTLQTSRTSRIFVQGRNPVSISGWNMKSPYRPNFLSTPACIIATGAGADAYAGAAQEWKGKREISVPNPAMSRAPMSSAWASSRPLAMKSFRPEKVKPACVPIISRAASSTMEASPR